MSGFQIFAVDATFRALRDFFCAPNQKNALSFPDFCQKAWRAAVLQTFEACSALTAQAGNRTGVL